MTSNALALQVERRIYLIGAEKVMLDYDLAALYGVPTKSLNLAVKRFHFETSKSRRGGRRYYFFANISISERNEGCYSGESKRPRVLFTTPSSRTPPGVKQPNIRLERSQRLPGAPIAAPEGACARQKPATILCVFQPKR